MTPCSIIDSHVHFWDPDRARYPWLASRPSLQPAHLPSDFTEHAVGLDVDQIVFVQAGTDVDSRQAELEFIDEQARQDPRITAVVGLIPIEQGPAAHDELRAFAQRPRARGVRRAPSQGQSWVHEDFLASVRLMGELGLTLDVLGCPPGLAGLATLCPETTFVIDHLGGPPLTQPAWMPAWREQIAQLADRPNVVCKLSGLCTAADHDAWTPADLEPAFTQAISSFGPGRLLFGSDWPVCTLAATYPQWVDAVLWMIRDLPAEHQRAILRDNAGRVYRLQVP